MANSSWSFPTSPRNPAKIAVELRILAALVDQWRAQGKLWSPQVTQIEFGEALRTSGMDTDADDSLAFQRQNEDITSENLAWTARARFGTYKFLGFVYIDDAGYADLTAAGKRLISTNRPDIVMLKQLLKWQYPDNQHRGARYPENVFNIKPFIAMARLIKDMGGLTKHELSLFCFTLTKMRDIRRVRKAISDFRVEYANTTGRVPKRRLIADTRRTLKAEYEARGIDVPYSSFKDYADSLARYMRYTGLFSIDGNRIVIARGREEEVDEITQLSLELQPYSERVSFYEYYGNPDIPTLRTDVEPDILQRQVRSLSTGIASLYEELGVLKQGTPLMPPSTLPEPLPDDIEALRVLLDELRDAKRAVELDLIDIRGRGPEKLAEALTFYNDILNHQTFDDATYLEWNTWRVFVALDHAQRIKPNLVMDENLQPVNTAAGGGPDIEVSFETYHVVLEVTMRRRTDQAYYETYPVIRHIEDFMNRVDDQDTFGLFIAPVCHSDTIHQFYVSWRYGVRTGKIVRIIPMTINQFREVVFPFTHPSRHFHPDRLRSLFDSVDQCVQDSSSSEQWGATLPQLFQQWVQQIEAPG